ncbi:MAG: HAMP domain-containing sensor histidine kinase [Chloroflexota bacterium]
MMRGRPLALRLALVLAGVVIVVLVAAGWVVNRAASRSLEETLQPRDEQRLEFAVSIVEDALARDVGSRGLHVLLERIVDQGRGHVRLLDADGTVVAEAGRGPATGAEVQRVTRDLSVDAGGGSLELSVPNPQAPFVRTFNAALLVTGIVAVLALLIAAAFLSDRLTRPVREVAAAARRLGGGDLSARARGGSDAESAELAGAFNGMAERLERSEELRRRAASDMAHDLATPATLLEMQLQAMLDGVVPADRAGLDRARSAAAALNGVIVQLGELIDAEAAALERHAEDVLLAELVRDAEAALAALAVERGVRLHIATSGDAIARIDRGQVGRALRNVVTNALQHTPSGGEVSVTVSGKAIRVSDAGGGIAAEDEPHIFERFYRADRARGHADGVRGRADRARAGERSAGEEHGGSGIGLTIARDLLAANGARIAVEATGPAGTTFLITLPR